MRGLGANTARLLDRFFGRELFSRQAAAVSVCLSFASGQVFNVLMMLLMSRIDRHPASQIRPFSVFISVVYLLVFSALALAPGFVRPRRLKTAWYLAIVFLILLQPIRMSFVAFKYHGEPLEYGATVWAIVTWRTLALLLALLISFASDFIFIATTRMILRFSSDLYSVWRIAAVVVLNCVLGVALFILPFLQPVYLARLHAPKEFVRFQYYSAWSVIAVGWQVAGFNAIDIIIVLVFTVLAILLLAQRIIWPVISRPLYSLQAIGVARRRKLVGAAGITLLGFATGLTPDIRKLIEAITG